MSLALNIIRPKPNYISCMSSTHELPRNRTNTLIFAAITNKEFILRCSSALKLRRTFTNLFLTVEDRYDAIVQLLYHRHHASGLRQRVSPSISIFLDNLCFCAVFTKEWFSQFITVIDILGFCFVAFDSSVRVIIYVYALNVQNVIIIKTDWLNYWLIDRELDRLGICK